MASEPTSPSWPKLILVFYFASMFCFGASERKAYSSVLNKYIQVCHRRDPQLSKCVKENIEKLKPFLKNGIPELAIPALEPLIIPEIIMNQGRGSAMNLVATYKDLHIWGTSTFNLRDFHVNLENNQIKFRIHFPKLVTKGLYKLDGRILMLPIVGNGFKEGNYSDVEGKVQIIGSRVHNQGLTYYHVEDVKIDLDVDYASIHFSNLFNGDHQLGDAMNSFINDNWRHVIKDMKPVLEQTIGDVVKDLFNGIYTRFPLEEILPH